jgi:hypothetical protein
MEAVYHGRSHPCFGEPVEYMVDQAAAINLYQGLGTVIG